jgi:cytidine deaminase
MDKQALVDLAVEAMENAYAPYSGFKVGAALLTTGGQVYLGCNIENVSFSPTNCAERTAFFKAVSEGNRDFSAIAIVGGKDGVIDGACSPCGVCRQVMAEFCDPDTFAIILGKQNGYEEYTLRELLPLGFYKDNLMDS